MTTMMRRGSKEWKRAWTSLASQVGDAVAEHDLEVWQYMGTTDGQHEFRHRSHPTRGRTIEIVAAS
jgi:hypothetical protein